MDLLGMVRSRLSGGREDVGSVGGRSLIRKIQNLLLENWNVRVRDIYIEVNKVPLYL